MAGKLPTNELANIITNQIIKKLNDVAGDLFGSLILGVSPGSSVDLVTGIQNLRKSIDILRDALKIEKNQYTSFPNINLNLMNLDKIISTLTQMLPELQKYVGPGLELGKNFLAAVEKWKQLTEEQREAFKNLGAATKGLIEGTFTVKDGNEVAGRATNIKWQANAMGESAEALLHLVNILHRYNFKDEQSLGLASKMNKIDNMSATKDGQKELQKKDDYEGVRFFAKYNPEILKPGHNALERLNMLIDAYAKALKDDSRNAKIHAEEVFGQENVGAIHKITEDKKSGRYAEVSAEELLHAQNEAKHLGKAESVNQADKARETAKWNVDVGALAVMEPFLKPILKLLTDFMNEHHELLSKLEGYGALGLEAYKIIDFLYKLYEALKALHQDKDGDNSDKDDKDLKPALVPEEVYTLAYTLSVLAERIRMAQEKPIPPHIEHIPMPEHGVPGQTVLPKAPAKSRSPINDPPIQESYGVEIAAGLALLLPGVAAMILRGIMIELPKYLLKHIQDYLPDIMKWFRGTPDQKLPPGAKTSSRLPMLDGASIHMVGDMKTIPLIGNGGGTWRTLQNRAPFAGDMAQANQHEKLLQTINNNQQFHTVINVTPSNSDPMQVAQLVYQKFQHATFNGNKAEPSKKSMQRGQAIWA